MYGINSIPRKELFLLAHSGGRLTGTSGGPRARDAGIPCPVDDVSHVLVGRAFALSLRGGSLLLVFWLAVSCPGWQTSLPAWRLSSFVELDVIVIIFLFSRPRHPPLLLLLCLDHVLTRSARVLECNGRRVWIMIGPDMDDDDRLPSLPELLPGDLLVLAEHHITMWNDLPDDEAPAWNEYTELPGSSVALTIFVHPQEAWACLFVGDMIGWIYIGGVREVCRDGERVWYPA